jgi:hypothetical protein
MTARPMRHDSESIITAEQLGRWLDRARRIGPAAPQLTEIVLRLADRPCRNALTEAREAACHAARTAFWDVQSMAAALATELEVVLDESASASAAPEPSAVAEMA